MLHDTPLPEKLTAMYYYCHDENIRPFFKHSKNTNSAISREFLNRPVFHLTASLPAIRPTRH